MKKFLLFIIFSTCSLASTVLTNTQATYTMANMLTKNTSIKVRSLFETSASMSYNQIETLKNQDSSKFDDVDVVIDLQRVWKQDSLYEFARRHNIRVIEIDASYSYQDNSALALSIARYHYKDDINPYVWLDFNNSKKMLEIIAHDLSLIYPKEAKTIKTNFDNSIKLINDLAAKYINNVKITTVFNLSENLNYLLTYLNISSVYIDVNTLTEEKIKELMEEYEINVFVTDRGMKRKIRKAIEDNGGTIIQLSTGELAVDDEANSDLMAKDGLLSIYKGNLEKLSKRR